MHKSSVSFIELKFPKIFFEQFRCVYFAVWTFWPICVVVDEIVHFEVIEDRIVWHFRYVFRTYHQYSDIKSTDQ